MGFGLVLIGYTFAYLMSLNSFGFLFRLVGTAVMLAGTSRLMKFEKTFFYVHISGILLALAATFETLSHLLLDYTSFDAVWLDENLVTALFVAFMVISIPFHLLFYRAARKISVDVGIRNITSRSVKYEIFFGAEIILVAATYVTFSMKAKIVNYFYMAAVILLYVVIFLNITLIYSCYKNICEEGDEEAPRKPSKLPFMNKLFEASEKREKEIYEKTKSYAEEQMKKDLDKKKARKDKKKRRK